MAELELPNRIIAYGEELLGDRINVYHKYERLRLVLDSLDPFEREFIKNSPLAMLLDIHNKPAWSTSFALFLLARMLNVEKKHEIWVIYGGTPVRFSLREFKIVTGLPCGKIPVVPKKKRKDTAGKEVPYYGTLFGLEEGVTVDRVIDILTKRTVNDPQLRLRYACLALVDGFLLPTSHHPKIIKDHAEMSKDIDAFVSYPWGRISFEMIMTSIKERNVRQLATTAVTVHGFLYALQLVLIEAVPSIQEGALPVNNDPVDSDDDADQVAPIKQLFPFKLGQARQLDASCEVKVTSIIRPEVEYDPEDEDITWSEDEEDSLVDNMVGLIGVGFEFENSMFEGGVVPSKIGHETVQPKRDSKSRVLRTRKVKQEAKKHVTPSRRMPTRGVNISPQPVRRSPRHPARPSGAPQFVDVNDISSMIDSKLEAFEKRIIEGITKWISDHVVFAVDQPNKSSEKEVSDRGENFDRGKQKGVQEDSVDDIAAYYNDYYGEAADVAGPSKPAPNEDHVSVDKQGSIGGSVNPVNLGFDAQGVVDDGPPIPATNEDHAPVSIEKQGSVGGSVNIGRNDDHSVNLGHEPQLSSDHVSVNTAQTQKVSYEDKQSSPSQYHNKESDVDPHHTTTEEIGDHSSCNVEPDSQKKADGEQSKNTNKDKETLNDIVENTETLMQNPPTTLYANKAKETLNDSVGNTDTDIFMQDSFTPDNTHKRKVQGKLDEASAIRAQPLAMVSVGKVVDIPIDKDVLVAARRSKRARMMSSQIDSRFVCDKQTKRLVGHPSPTQSEAEVENRFEDSMEKLKTRCKISLGDGVFLSNKDVLSLLERKKPISTKVLDALMKFSRFLLRTADVDGKKLRVDVLNSHFIAQLSRVHPKFVKAANPDSFVFPTELIDSIAGRGVDSDRVELFTEVDCIYAPFNFDRKHWVALCIDLREASILVLDTNVQGHSDSQIESELKHIAAMLPYLLKAARPNIALPTHIAGKPFLIQRKLGLCQVSNPADSGLCTIFLIHAHATGGFEECRAFFLYDIPYQLKKLVCGLIQSVIH